MITENLSTLKIHKLTKEQYDRELTAGNIDETALYLTPEEENDKAIYKKKLITLPTTGWVGDYAPYTINISIDGVLENSDVQITPMLEMTLEQLDAWENLRLYAGKTYYGYITLKANGFKPNVEIPLEVLIGSEIIEATVEEITE